jgi:hypothetical protein
VGPGKVQLGEDFVLDLPSLSPAFAFGDVLTLAVRPEAVNVGPPDDNSGLQGRIIRAAFRGSEMEYEIEPIAGRLPAGLMLRALVSAGSNEPPMVEGQTVSIHVQPSDWAVLPGDFSTEAVG